MPVTEIKPDNNSSASKKQQVEQMFNDIAHKYDFLNRFLSLGIDRGWRKAAIKSIAEINPKIILDVATGTADLAIAALKLKPEHITGIDISAQMLAEGQVKIDKKGFNKQIQLMKGDSEA
jgi:demethylmenaquinone methyltransferase/2-methoxy-6-polyprenyl-1,4-benzoquinol methylase